MIRPGNTFGTRSTGYPYLGRRVKRNRCRYPGRIFSQKFLISSKSGYIIYSIDICCNVQCTLSFRFCTFV